MRITRIDCAIDLGIGADNPTPPTLLAVSVGKVVCFSIFLNLEILFFQIYHCKELSFLFSKLERMITKHDDAKCVNKALCCMQSGFEVK